MGWFGNSQGERIAELERLVSALTARVVKAEATASDCAERAYRYMKKAEARSRRELDEPNQEPTARPASDTPVDSSSRRVWGARGRRLMRSLRPSPHLSPEEGANGNGEE